MLEDIKYLVDMGFACHILARNSKSPVEEKWTSAKKYTFSELKAQNREWTGGKGNVGVRLGEPSVVDGLYLHAIDLDIRDPKAAGEAQDALEQILAGYKLFKFWTVRSGSGGASRHYYFLTDRPFRTKNLRKSADFIVLDGKKRRAWEIDLMGTGKQAVLPPSIHPDTRKPYEWVVEPDDFPVVIDSDHLEDLLVDDEDYEDIDNDEPLLMDDDEVWDVLRDVQHLSDDRDTWLMVGFALKHQYQHDDKAGWKIFDDWSKRGENYNPTENRNQWRTFKNDKTRKITMRTVMKHARDAALVGIADEFDDDTEVLNDVAPKRVIDDSEEIAAAEVERTIVAAPKEVLRIPGMLQEVVDQFNKNSSVPQPEFAVMAAIAIGSVIASRNVVSDRGNYTSLYMVGVARSGGGKEFVRTVVSTVLTRCNLEYMIGPENFSSEGGMLSELQRSARIIALTDEFGKRMATDKGGANQHTDSTYTAIMSLFSQLGVMWRPRAYSTLGKTPEEAKAILERHIIRPALSMLAVTTPKTFLASLKDSDVSSGLLSRFIIVKGTGARTTKLPTPSKIKISDEFKKWAQKMSRMEALDEDGEEEAFAGMGGINDLVEPYEIKISDAAVRLLEGEIGQFILDESDRLSEHGLEDLWNRAREITMRISMIVSLSKGELKEVSRDSVVWAWRYVKHYVSQTVEDFKKSLGVSGNVEHADAFAAMICAHRADGMTKRELSKASRLFRNLSMRDLQEVEALMERNHEIRMKKFEGSKRQAYVAPKASWTRTFKK